MKEGVESAIIECGIGGEYDSTNILPPEAVTVSAITRLGIDHTGMLGETIEQIALHKAGIMKSGVPAFTVQQVPEAQAVLASRAHRKGVELKVVTRHPDVGSGNVQLGLEGEFQKDNASLAIAVARSHLESLHVNPGSEGELDKNHPEWIPEKFKYGLKTVKWQGRCEVRDEGNIRWLIDGAHTVDSIKETARWYQSKLKEAQNSSKPPTATMLIFNQQDRDAVSLISALINTSRAHVRFRHESKVNPYTTFLTPARFRYAAFCTNTAFKSEVPKDVDLSRQQNMGAFYERADANPAYMCCGSVEEAVELARRISESEERLLVLVTGSLHLVGGLIRVLAGDRRDLDVPDG
jgi:folylpolyglutamate synthase